MPRRKIGEENVRKIIKSNNGAYLISLPIEYVRQLKWQDNQQLKVLLNGKKLIIEDWQK